MIFIRDHKTVCIVNIRLEWINQDVCVCSAHILCACIIGFLQFNAILIKFCENDEINVMWDVHYVIYAVFPEPILSFVLVMWDYFTEN